MAIHIPRRAICVALAIFGLWAHLHLWAQTSISSRPSLERFVQTARLSSQARLWAIEFADIAKQPSHPLHTRVEQIQNASDSELLALLVQTFQAVSEEDTNELVALLETPLGQWVVQASLWRRTYFAKKQFDPSDFSKSGLRKLSNTEILAIKAMGNTPSWQAMRRAGDESIIGSELITALDWPRFEDLMLDRSQP